MSDWHKKISNNCSRITNMSYRLQDMSHAFRVTGNETVAEDLEAIASVLAQSSETINDSVGECIHEQYVGSQKNSVAIFEAVLAGAELDKRGTNQ
jgi:hypothetical protein